MLSPELVRLIRNFQTRPGANEARRAEFVASARAAALPADYLDFMAFSNGGYGRPGENGLWVRLDPLEDVLLMTRGQGAPAGLLLIGGTRLGDGLAIDARQNSAQVITVSLAWWGAFDVLDVLGPSLEAALQTLESMGPPAPAWGPAARPLGDRRPDIGFVPTPQPVVEAMLAAAGLQRGETVYDLGCGDGRIVITAARKFGARGVGFDLNFELIQVARAAAAAAGVRHTAVFRRADIFTLDLSPADVVTLYLLRDINARLLPQLNQLRPGARVVSYEFGIPDLAPARTELVEYTPGVRGRVLVWEAPLQPAQAAQQQQQDDRPHNGSDDLVHNAGADVQAEHTEKPTAEQGAQDADNNGADKADVSALDEELRNQPGNPADDNPDHDLF
jgi:ubiquinone/menaquinone biosynthesis C-methylase UbiE